MKAVVAGLLGFGALVAAGAAVVAGLDATPYHLRVASAPGAWRAEVRPARDAARVDVRVDGLPAGQGPDGRLAVALDRLGPGYHFVEATLARRGGRREVVTDAVLAGPFATPGDRDGRCNVAVAVGEDAFRRVARPIVERQLLDKVRAIEHFGPGTRLTRAELAFRDGGLAFAFALEGVRDVAFDGLIDAEVGPEGALGLRLRAVNVTPGPRLLEWAESQGRTGGGLLGALALGVAAAASGGSALVVAGAVGVGAWAGAEIGEDVVHSAVHRKAREAVQGGLETALRRVQVGLAGPFAVVPGEPRSAVRARFCPDPVFADGALRARLAVEPVGAEWTAGTTVWRDAVPLPLAGGAPDLRVELSVDLLNALLAQWTASGLVRDLLGRTGLVERANETLAEWTRLRIVGLETEGPPVVSPPRDGALGLAVGGLALRLRDGREGDERRVIVAGAGRLGPTLRPPGARVVLSGAVDALHLTCEAHAEGARVLEPCFSGVIELDRVAAGLNERLTPDASGLPSFDLAAPLAAVGAGIAFATLDVAATGPHGAIVRLDAKLAR